MNILYKLLVFILINALVLGQIRTGPAPVKIGYVGTDITGYDDWLAEELEQKLLEIFSDLSQEQYIDTQYFNEKIDVNAFYSDINNDSFAKLSDEIDADYFFAGKIDNPTPNRKRFAKQPLQNVANGGVGASIYIYIHIRRSLTNVARL